MLVILVIIIIYREHDALRSYRCWDSEPGVSKAVVVNTIRSSSTFELTTRHAVIRPVYFS
jgi:hypothetical protein